MLEDKPCKISQVNTIAEYFLLKTAVKDSLKTVVWNRWCFWCHKLPCKQSYQQVVLWDAVNVWRRG